MTPQPGDDEARERARERLQERQARLHGALPPRGASRATHQDRARASEPAGDFPSQVSGALQGLSSRFGPRAMLAVLAAAVLVVVLAVAFSVRACTAPAEPQDALPAAEPAVAVDRKIDEAALESILGADLAKALVQAAEESEDAAWIAAHPSSYSVDGQAVQYKLLKLAATEPAALPFVRQFPEAYPADSAGTCDAPAAGEVPRLYQWDPRWGSTVYCSTTFALTGCCPTSLAMVYQGLTGKGDLSPYDLGVRAQKGGYMIQFDGTDAAFLVDEAASLGLSCTVLPVDAAALESALSKGEAVICNVGPGDFTDGGHFFVISGLSADGRLIVNDPYSAERSEREWDVGQVLGQTMALYAYARA